MYTHGTLVTQTYQYTEYSTSIGMFLDDFPIIIFIQVRHFHSDLGFLELFTLQKPYGI